MKATRFFHVAERQRLRNAVESAEQQTSGEIRVFIDDHCREDVLDRAAYIFTKLGMENTRQRNGVLIYLALDDKKFAIIGDAGIHAKVGDTFWNEVREGMAGLFRQGKIIDGLEYAVMEAGTRLREFFPRSSGDINELPDDLHFGDGGAV